MFIDIQNIFPTITTSYHDPKESSIGSDSETILCSTRSSTTRNIQVNNAEMAGRMLRIRVQNSWNNEPAIMLKETTNLSLTEMLTIYRYGKKMNNFNMTKQILCTTLVCSKDDQFRFAQAWWTCHKGTFEWIDSTHCENYSYDRL